MNQSNPEGKERYTRRKIREIDEARVRAAADKLAKLTASEVKNNTQQGKYNTELIGYLKTYISNPYSLLKRVPRYDLRDAPWSRAWLRPGNINKKTLYQEQSNVRISEGWAKERQGKNPDKYPTAMDALYTYGKKPVEEARLALGKASGGSLTLIDGKILKKWGQEAGNLKSPEEVAEYAKSRDEQISYGLAAAIGMGFYTDASKKALPYGNGHNSTCTNQIVNFKDDNELHQQASERITQAGGAIPENPGYLLESYTDKNNDPLFRISLIDTNTIKDDLYYQGIRFPVTRPGLIPA